MLLHGEAPAQEAKTSVRAEDAPSQRGPRRSPEPRSRSFVVRNLRGVEKTCDPPRRRGRSPESTEVRRGRGDSGSVPRPFLPPDAAAARAAERAQEEVHMVNVGRALTAEDREALRTRARPAVEDQVAVAVRGRHRRGSMRRERTGDGGSEQGGTRERSRHASTALLEVRKLAVASPSSRKRKVPAGEDLRFG